MNEIYRCPNCSYMLVLLERRRKFKCAKCSRLYYRKEIEDQDFREWNLKQRTEDKIQYKKDASKTYFKSK
ncbi:MAG: hypothetical protein AABX71_00830, partial [Nanoarchaeota archaeon]